MRTVRTIRRAEGDGQPCHETVGEGQGPIGKRAAAGVLLHEHRLLGGMPEWKHRRDHLLLGCRGPPPLARQEYSQRWAVQEDGAELA